MLKIESDYKENYGDIPLDYHKRLEILIRNLRKKKRKSKIDIFEEVKRISNIEWETYEFIVYLVPKATPRPRVNYSRAIFYVKGSSDNRKLFKSFIKKNPHPLITTPLYMEVCSYLPTPKSLSDEDKILAEMGYIRPISKPDFDNLAKTYADMMNGLLIYDDALIIKGTSEKFYSIKPRIEIKLTYMKEFDSLFNRKKIESKI